MNLLRTLCVGVAVVGGALAFAPRAHAVIVDVTWDLTVPQADNICAQSLTDGFAGELCAGEIGPDDGPYDTADADDFTAASFAAYRGNILEFTGDSPNEDRTLRAAAFSIDGDGDDAMQTAALMQYSPGLGVINSPDDGNHTVENNGYKDLIIFHFGEDDYDPISATLALFADGDVDVYIGGAEADFLSSGNPFAGFAGATLDDLVGTFGFLHYDFNCEVEGGDPACTNPLTLNFTPDDGTETGRYLVIAADIDGMEDVVVEEEDYSVGRSVDAAEQAACDVLGGTIFPPEDGNNATFHRCYYEEVQYEEEHIDLGGSVSTEEQEQCDALGGEVKQFGHGASKTYKCKYKVVKTKEKSDGFKVTIVRGVLDEPPPPPPPPPPGLPEPLTLALVGLGLTGLGIVARRRKAA